METSETSAHFGPPREHPIGGFESIQVQWQELGIDGVPITTSQNEDHGQITPLASLKRDPVTLENLLRRHGLVPATRSRPPPTTKWTHTPATVRPLFVRASA